MPRSKRIALIIFFVYLTVLVKLILFKGPLNKIITHFATDFTPGLWVKSLDSANFYPFHTIHYYLSGQDTTGTIPNLVGNIILFIPLGWFLPTFLFNKINWQNLVTAALIISLCFEITQLIMAYGSFDVDDCILNTLGASIGFAIFRLVPTRFLQTESSI